MIDLVTSLMILVAQRLSSEALVEQHPTAGHSSHPL
jgi:hypothetical protein